MPSQGSAISLNDIVDFVRAATGFEGEMSGSTGLEADVGIWGDAHDALMSQYAEKYGVDMSGYLWYFHTREEPFFPSFGFVFKPPYSRVTRMDITVGTLLEGANTGRWPVKYPPHSLPRYRYDVIASYVVIVAFIAVVAWAILSR